MSEPINPVEFGEMRATIASLSKSVEDLAREVKALRDETSRGKGILWGIILAAGGMGGAAGHVLERVIK